MAQPYQHAPLESPDSIRLLDLLPSLKRTAPVECRVRQMTFENACDKYEALSYVWGALDGDRPITCDGCELLITPNCHDAIVHLRYRFRVRTLWIDSICIDQRETPDSTKERNHQVKQMGVVYQNASRVLVWLGLNTSDSNFQMQYGNSLTCHWSLEYMLFARCWSAHGSLEFGPFKCTPEDNLYVPGYFDNSSGMLSDTSKEFAFAKESTFIWGKLHFEWMHIEYLARLFAPFYGAFTQAIPLRSLATLFINKNSSHRVNWDHLYPGAVSPPAELRFVLSLKFQQSKLIHDKVYGVYAILTSMGVKMPEPDYSRPAVSVMEEFTWAYISSRQYLDLITAEISVGNSPTWIPEYFISLKTPFHNFGIYARGRTQENLQYHYRASGNSRSFITDEKLPGRLVVRGKRVDFVQSRTVRQTIHTTDPNPLEFENFRDFIPVCQYWCRTCTELLQMPEQTAYKTSESLWRAVLGSITNNLVNIADWVDLMLYPNCRNLSPAEVERYSRPLNTAEAEYQPLSADIILDYLVHTKDQKNDISRTQASVNKFVNWAFLVTGNSYIGRAYRTCQEGDELWLLAGSANPVLLRQSGNDYQYIAPASFHGMMEGELWPEDETELETITLI
ncbi:hypothetical protein PG991_014781 [Apiospora marii]|uniref:Heterokaryon incompatibility domain-containing protein n=1 Tax=Apiospora marii TaxID=335849 RepID=A0ABR1R4J4_9PEZI